MADIGIPHGSYHQAPKPVVRSYEQPVIPGLERLGMALFALLVFFSSAAFIEPSPYEFVAPLAVLYWVCVGLRLSVHIIFMIACLVLYNLGGFISLTEYFDETDSVIFMLQSAYLAITAVFFAMLVSRRTEKRVEVALTAYAASCVFASILGIMGAFNIAGTQEIFATWGRAAGPFKDPNVFGSFLTMGALFLMQNLLLGRARIALLSLSGLLIILVGILLSGSRGSWGGSLVAIALTVGFTFFSSRSMATRRRILVIGVVTFGFGIASIMAALSVPEVRELFEKRASVTQEYDEGETGRFGNQLRSIPMLMEEPNGFGPLRFRKFFSFDPHNSYVGGFASYGWLGGFSFILLVISSSWVGFRLCASPSPYQRQAQVAFPGLFMFFLQAFQIDIDHWRHVYLMLGLVWGIEAARRRWLTTGLRE
jgi:hypothetical protein